MKKIEKKTFFRRPTVAQIKAGKEPVLLEGRIITGLRDLRPDQYAFIPEGVFDFSRWGSKEKFIKHGPFIPIPKRSQHDLIAVGDEPKKRFRETVEGKVGNLPYVSGFTFYPVMGNDQLPRKVLLVELLEAARIMAYGKFWPPAKVTSERDYKNAKRAAKEGGSFIVTTPSRRKEHSRYRFKVSSVPVVDNNFAYVNPYSFSTQGIGVESKAFRELRFKRESDWENSRYSYIQAHEIAAFYEIALSELEDNNLVPANFGSFPVVSQELVDLYQTMINRTLVQERNGKGKLEMKLLGQAHIEKTGWDLARDEGFDVAFNQNGLAEVRDYQWNTN